jgi:hypothetical protein
MGNLFLSLIVFCLDGYFFLGHLRNTITIKSNAFPSKIKIEFGDLFNKDGWKIIPVNDFFDSLVNESIVSSKSLHGQMIKRFWSGNGIDWDNQVEKSLNGLGIKEVILRKQGKDI